MTDELKAKIAAAVAAAIEVVEKEETETPAEPEPPEPHRFGLFRLPKDAHIKGLLKFCEDTTI